MKNKKLKDKQLKKVIGGEDIEIFGEAEELYLTPKEKKELKDK